MPTLVPHKGMIRRPLTTFFFLTSSTAAMASAKAFFFFNLILLSTSSFNINGENTDWFSETKLLHEMKEKVSHLHFYFHDTVSGNKPSAIPVAGPKDKGFGTVVMADEPLTEGPEPTSKLIGRAQGMYALAAQEEVGLLMVLNYVFLEGKYNGSTLSVLGRNPIFHPVREMPIVGGSGLFRFARGYAQAHTHWFNTKGDAIVEYNVTVLHY